MALFLRPPLESAIVTLRHGSGQARPDCLARCPYRIRRKMLDRKMHRLSPDWIRSGYRVRSPQDSAMSAYMIFATVLQASEY
jgi:hypothetical protein